MESWPTTQWGIGGKRLKTPALEQQKIEVVTRVLQANTLFTTLEIVTCRIVRTSPCVSLRFDSDQSAAAAPVARGVKSLICGKGRVYSGVERYLEEQFRRENLNTRCYMSDCVPLTKSVQNVQLSDYFSLMKRQTFSV